MIDEAPMPEADAGRHVISRIVGAAMLQGIGHPLQQIPIDRAPPPHIEVSDDAAHGLAPWLPAWSAAVADEAAQCNRHGPVTKAPRRVRLAGS